MRIFDDKRVLLCLIVGFGLWVTLPFLSRSTLNTELYQLPYGYVTAAKLNKHPNPPTIGSDIFKKVVWRHNSISVLWLPFWGTKAGEYGLYRSERTREYNVIRGNSRRSDIVHFVPLNFEDAKNLAAEVIVTLQPEPPIAYWSLYYGWLVLLPFCLIFYFNPNFYRKL